MSDLRQWIERLIHERYGTATKLADALQMSVSAFSRSTKAGTLSTENLLRLAIETGEPAPAVFAMAGKADVNALIVQLYGAPAVITDAETMRLATLIASLSPESRDALTKLVEAWPRPHGTDSTRRTRRR